MPAAKRRSAKAPDPPPFTAWLPWLLLPVGIVAGFLRIQAGDFFWHLVSGRWILSHARIPRVDPFRFTAGPDTPWVDHEWGFQLLLASSERLGGDLGPALLRALIVGLVVTLLYVALRRRNTPTGMAVALTTAAVVGARGRFFLRPELVSVLFFLALLLLLERYRQHRRGAAPALVALVVVWANVHPAVLMSIPIAVAFLVGDWLLSQRAAASGALRALALPPALAAAALVNPWGYEVFLVPGKIRRSLADLPLTNPDWASFGDDPQPYLLVFLAVTAAIVISAQRRAWRLDWAQLGVVAALVPLVYSSVRHQGFLFLAAALLAGSASAYLAQRSKAAARRAERGSIAPAVVTVAAAVAWCLWPPSSGPLEPAVRHHVGVRIVEELFPAGATDELQRWDSVGNLFNNPPFGGYLLWRLFPPRQVFNDTRNEVDPELLHELARARGNDRSRRALFQRYDIDGAIVRYEGVRQVAPAVPGGRIEQVASSKLLFPPEDFALVYWDDVAMLYLRRTTPRRQQLYEREFRFVDPEDWQGTLRRAATNAAYRRGLEGELARKLLEDPDCRRALEFERLLTPGGPS